MSDRIRNRTLFAFVEIGAAAIAPDAGGSGEIAYHAENALMDDARRWVAGPINDAIRGARLAETDIDPAVVAQVTRYMPVEALGLVSLDEAGGVTQAVRTHEGLAIFRPLIMMMAMFMLVVAGVAPLTNAVLEEKMQRIAEVLLGSLRPFELMAGKLVGTVMISLTILALYAGAALVLAYRYEFIEYVPFELLPWFLAFLIAAILMFGSLLIGLTAACSDLKEAQSMMMPIWLLLMIPMFIWLPVVKEPLSPFATWASLIPPATPALMLLRQATPTGVPAWQPWVGLAGVLLFTTLVVWIAGRIFRITILMQGKAPKLTELIKWAVRG